MSQPGNGTLTVEGASLTLDKSTRQIQRMIKDGLLQKVRDGNHVMVTNESVEKYLSTLGCIHVLCGTKAAYGTKACKYCQPKYYEGDIKRLITNC
jgi:excisionase family DNA binding protein